jgi:hypothetical protein
MADRYTQVVVLCEDLMHLNFVRRFLIQRGIKDRRIHGKISPSGRGAASQFVIETYPTEVQAIRSKPHLRAGLVAVIDADNQSVADRLRQLEQSLMQSGKSSRKADERIAALSPKRNIETWIFHLCGNAVDEETDYKNRVSSADIKPSVAAFAEACPEKCETLQLPSLQHACKELTAFIERGK